MPATTVVRSVLPQTQCGFGVSTIPTVVENRTLAQRKMPDVSSSPVRGATVDEVDARSISSNRRSPLKLLELLAGYDVDSSRASPGGVPTAFLLPCQVHAGPIPLSASESLPALLPR